MTKGLLLGLSILLTGCQTLPEPVCYGKATIGGAETTIPIYAVKKEGNYTLYRAGHQYNWRWVGIGAFDKTTCDVEK
ncbi:hypothetical protein DAY62_23450 [Salmonella enterica subsp. enterica serovar Enteritidis]|nr:hypothetical protein [Salmonella enterica subsp. enterica serovar Enteritidis]